MASKKKGAPASNTKSGGSGKAASETQDTSALFADLVKLQNSQDFEKALKVCNKILNLAPADDKAFQSIQNLSLQLFMPGAVLLVQNIQGLLDAVQPVKRVRALKGQVHVEVLIIINLLQDLLEFAQLK